MKELLSREECRGIQMDILDQISKLCEKNNITYYLAYGSLLGAVRHKGFIPWDDDIDICLMREEYEKLLKILKTQKDIPWLGVIDGEVKDYYYTFAKAVDNRTVAKMEDNYTEHGIWVDIFPMDGVPENKILCKVFMNICFGMRAVILSMTTDFSGAEKGKKTMVKRILNQVAVILGKKRVYRLYDRLCRRYPCKTSLYVANLFSAYGARDRMKRARIVRSKVYPFEDRQYTGFADYEYYLSNLYGDYMKLPPEEKRRTHSIQAYRKQ